MSTKSLLSHTPTKTPEKAEEKLVKVTREDKSQRVKKTITLDPKTVKALNKLRAHITVEEDQSTDFGRIIDDAVLHYLQTKGLSL